MNNFTRIIPRELNTLLQPGKRAIAFDYEEVNEISLALFLK